MPIWENVHAVALWIGSTTISDTILATVGGRQLRSNAQTDDHRIVCRVGI
jgi:hypothetical protein